MGDGRIVLQWLLGIVATVVGAATVGVVGWLIQRLNVLDRWKSAAEERLSTAEAECQRCRAKISDVVKIAHTLEETRKGDQHRDREVASFGVMIAQHGRELGELRGDLRGIDGKLDALTKLIQALNLMSKPPPEP